MVFADKLLVMWGRKVGDGTRILYYAIHVCGDSAERVGVRCLALTIAWHKGFRTFLRRQSICKGRGSNGLIVTRVGPSAPLMIETTEALNTLSLCEKLPVERHY